MEHTREPIIQELNFNIIIKGKLHIIHYDNNYFVEDQDWEMYKLWF